MSATNETLPINVTVYINGDEKKHFNVYWYNQTVRINLDFNSDIVKADDRFLILFYLIITFLGIGFWVSINLFAKGFGIIGLGAWYLLWALQGFEVLFFPVSMIAFYYGFKLVWGRD